MNDMSLLYDFCTFYINCFLYSTQIQLRLDPFSPVISRLSDYTVLWSRRQSYKIKARQPCSQPIRAPLHTEVLPDAKLCSVSIRCGFKHDAQPVML